jgi:hypothetical protein
MRQVEREASPVQSLLLLLLLHLLVTLEQLRLLGLLRHMLLDLDLVRVLLDLVRLLQKTQQTFIS